MSIHRSHIFSPSDLPDAPSQYAFPDATLAPVGISAEDVANMLEQTANRMRLPLSIEVDALKPQSFFGHKTPCVTARHPNPPRDYYGLIAEVPKAERRSKRTRITFWLHGSSSTLDVVPGIRMKSVRSRITDEATLKRPEDWTIIPELDYYQRLFEAFQRALKGFA